MIPPEVFEATNDIYGPVGLLPTIVADGGALLLVIVLLVSFARYRTPWAQQCPADGDSDRARLTHRERSPS
jgi:hypothetical protein